MSESTAAPIPCRVGLLPNGCWIESPRTGKRLSFTREIFCVLPRVWGRIVQTTSVGQQIIPFTKEELLAVKSFAEAKAEHEAAKRDDPPIFFGMKFRGVNDYLEFCRINRGVRSGGYDLRADDTFLIDCHTTDWPPFGIGLWFRHPCGPAMVVAGPSKEALPAGVVAKFNGGKSAVFTGAELNALNAACTATRKLTRPIRPRRRRFGF